MKNLFAPRAESTLLAAIAGVAGVAFLATASAGDKPAPGQLPPNQGQGQLPPNQGQLPTFQGQNPGIGQGQGAYPGYGNSSLIYSQDALPANAEYLQAWQLGAWRDIPLFRGNVWRDYFPTRAYSNFAVVVQQAQFVRLDDTFYVQCQSGEEFRYPLMPHRNEFYLGQVFPNQCPGYLAKKITTQAGLDSEHHDAAGNMVYYGF